MFSLPPDKPESLKPPVDSKKFSFNIPIESQEQKPYVFGRKPAKEYIDPILTLRDVHHPLPGTSTILPAFKSLSFEEFEQAEQVDLRSDEETSSRKYSGHPGPHLYRIDHATFHEQTYGPQHIQDFGQLYSIIDRSVEVQPDMYVDRKIPQKSYAPDSASVWSIDDRTPQEIMLILENMITAYKVNVLHGMTVLNAVNAIIYGFEGILKNWYVAVVRAKPTILDEWSKTVMIGEDGKPSILSDGTTESNYIGKMISAIREEFCGEIKDTQQIQETFLYRQRLKKIEYFHPYYTLWLRRLFELETCLDEKWKTTFIVSLPKWFIPKVQKFVTVSGSTLSWGILYNMVLGSIIEMCDEKARVRRSLKDERTPNLDTVCKQYNLPYGKSTFHPGHPVSHQGEHKHKSRKKHKTRKHKDGRTERSSHKKRRSHKGKFRSYRSEKKPEGKPSQKRYPSKTKVKCFGCGGPHYKSQCPKKGKLKASMKAMLIENGCPNAEEIIEDFFDPKHDQPLLYVIGDKEEEGYITGKEELETGSDNEQYVSVSNDSYDSYDSYDSGTSSDSDSTTACGEHCKCPDCRPAVSMMRPNFRNKGKGAQVPEDASEETKILMDLLQTDSEAGKEILRKKYMKILEQEKITKQKDVKKTVNPELYNRVSLLRNTAQFENIKPRVFSDFHELSLDHQKLTSRVDKLEKEVMKTKEFQQFAEQGEASTQWTEEMEDERPKEFVRKYFTPSLHINSIITKNNNIRVAFYIGDKRHVTTALIDSGASVNCIHSSLIPQHMIQPSMMSTIAVIGNSKRPVTGEAQFSLALDKDARVRLPMLAIVEDNVRPMLILGNPFLQSTKPNGWRDTQITEDGYQVEIELFWFTFKNRIYKYRITGTPQDNHQVLKIEKGLKERKHELKLIAQSTQAQDQLESKAKLQKAIADMQRKYETLYKPRPEQWKNNQHYVKLPYHKDFEIHPTRSTAIAMSAEQQALCKAEIADLEARGLIRKSRSEWSCFGFYVNKRSEIIRNKPRLVINYQPLNAALAYDAYPIPKPTSLLAKLSHAVIFSKFDMKSGFWQIKITPSDIYKTAFTVPQGHYEWTVMPFGLNIAPSKFQRVMDSIFGDLDFVLVYIDDLLVFSSDIPTHFKHLNLLYTRIYEAGLILSATKAFFFQTKITFLGREIQAGGVKMMDHSLEFVHKFPDVILDKTQLQRFLGSVNYISAFYPNLAFDRILLDGRLKDNPEPWTEEHIRAIQRIKANLGNLPRLSLIDEDLPKRVYTDASELGWGAVLVQVRGAKEELITLPNGSTKI